MQATIRKAQGEHEKKIAPEVKTDNEKSFPEHKEYPLWWMAAAPPPRRSESNLLTDTVSEKLMGLCLGRLTKGGQRTDPTKTQLSPGTEKKYQGRAAG